MFENLLRIFSGDINAAKKKETEIKESTPPVKVKFKSDIDALEEKFGNPLKGEISMTLTDALELIPRDRKRVDAYKALQKYLSERGVNLVVKSQKTKKQL